MFTTGLTFVAGLTWIPSNLGSWYAKAGFQYYDVINNALIASNHSQHLRRPWCLRQLGDQGHHRRLRRHRRRLLIG